MSTSQGGGAAGDAQVSTDVEDAQQAQRERYAAEAEANVDTITAKLAGMKESLATAKAEAKRLRAEAQNGGQD